MIVPVEVLGNGISPITRAAGGRNRRLTALKRPEAGGQLSRRLVGRQAQARQEKLAVLGVAQMQNARHDLRGDGAQSGDDRARFVEPAHMGIARGEKAVWGGKAWVVLNGQEQL